MSRDYTFLNHKVTIQLHSGNNRTSRNAKQRTFFNQVYQKVGLGTHKSKAIFIRGSTQYVMKAK